ncbi:MAG: cobalt-precorrin-6A reductase [Acidimicrobiales bacterium]
MNDRRRWRVRVLVLAGSTEGRRIAGELAGHPAGVEVITSLAGRTLTPRALPGLRRVGGFGGIDGLARWLSAEHITAVVDATHPFAASMPGNAAAACAATGIPRLRLRRPGWLPEAGDRWTVVSDLGAAATTLVATGARRVFLTTGRQELRPFTAVPRAWFLVRSIDPPDPLPLQRAQVILACGPFDLDGEEALMEAHRIDTLVTKDSGGDAAAPKLVAARRLGIPVVLVARPPAPPGPCVTTVDAALEWCEATFLAALAPPTPEPQAG